MRRQPFLSSTAWFFGPVTHGLRLTQSTYAHFLYRNLTNPIRGTKKRCWCNN